MNKRIGICALIGLLAAIQVRSEESGPNVQTNNAPQRLQTLNSFPIAEAKRLAAGVLRNAKKTESEMERRRSARAYLALFLPETAMDLLKSEANQSTAGSEQILVEMVGAEALRQVFSFSLRASDLQVELTKMKYSDATNFESVTHWLVAKANVVEASGKTPAVVAIDISRTWLEATWRDEDGVSKLVALKTALDWMQASLAGCAEVTVVVNPTTKDKISCQLTLAEVLAVGQPPKRFDCDSLSSFLSTTKNLWTTQGKVNELRKTLESVLLKIHLNLIE